jgi:cysteine desulfurase
MITYFDYHSAKPVDERVVDAMRPYYHERFGNPSSLHQIGDEATRVLEKSRESVAGLLGAVKDEIIFTSGATEANNLALIGYAMRNRNKGDHIIISEIEHISLHNIAKYLEKNGFSVSRVPVDHYGRVSLKKLAARIDKKTILVSINYANNEIGTLQPVAEIGRLCRERNIVFHSDAVAAEGLIPIDVKRDNIDLLSISSNDIYGPQGVGALYARDGVKLQPLIIGGGQERGLRSGTENMPGIVGMAKAADIVKEEIGGEAERLRAYRDTLIREILERIPDSHLNGHPRERLPNNAHFRFDGIEGEALLLSLKDKGNAVRTGSACSSKTLEASHTLIALGLLHEEAHGSLQLTCGRFTSDEDINKIIGDLPEVVQRLRKLSPLYKEENSG